MYRQQIERIREKLNKVMILDSDCTLFGARSHKYKLDPVYTQEQIAQFEQTWNIKLPEEYAAFITTLGGSGAGPFYGLEKLENTIYDDLDYKDETSLTDISGSFTFTNEWNLKRPNDEASKEEWLEWEKEYYHTKWAAGTLKISNVGCAISVILIINGLSYGEVWIEDRANGQGIFPVQYTGNTTRLTFLDWYEAWLDRSLKQLKDCDS